MYDNRTAIAIADAQRDALVRATYPADTGPVDPDVAARESLQALQPMAPSVGVAAALLSVASVHPVPLDRESLEPTAGPLTTLAEVDAHWRRALADGVGVRAGVQPNGSTIFAVRGPLAALRGWLADVGTEPDVKVNEHGGVVHSGRTYRAGTPFVSVTWSPPRALPARSVVSYGVDLFADSMRNNRSDDERALQATAWLAWTAAAVWTVAPSQTPEGETLAGQGQRRLTVRSRRLGQGVEVVGEGDVIPWHVRRGNGWTCSAPNMPIASDQPLTPWITEAVGAKWTAVR